MRRKKGNSKGKSVKASVGDTLRVKITSVPGGATVLLNSKSIGLTPMEVMLTEDITRLSLIKAGYSKLETQLDKSLGKTAYSFTLSTGAKKKAASVEDKITIADDDEGLIEEKRTPKKKKKVYNKAKKRVVKKKETKKAKEEPKKVEEKKNAVKEPVKEEKAKVEEKIKEKIEKKKPLIKAIPKGKSTRVFVFSKPKGAKIFVDGQPIGKKAPTFVTTSMGKHTFKLTLNGKSAEKTFVLSKKNKAQSFVLK